MTVQGDVAAWLDSHWDPELGLREWRELLADSGWGCPTWPVEWFGRGLSAADAEIVQREFARIGAVGAPSSSAVNLAAPTILEHGSDLMKSTFLRPAAVGAQKWTQLFSEPGSGSDLAGVTTRAELDGDTWIVNGQKVWNSGAETADYAMLLARTDWDATKHRGITWMAMDMHQPGVDVRPLKQMNGHSTFSEVFLTDARVPVAHVAGTVNDGWRVATTTLMSERNVPAVSAASPAVPAGRCHREAAEEAAKVARMYSWYPQRYGRADLVAQAHSNDPHVRQQIARVVTLQRIAAWNAGRARANLRRGGSPGPEGSLAKLMVSELARASATAHAQLAGAQAMVDGTLTAEVLLSVPAVSIAGGTDEIQKNIVAERVLGLPKDPTSDAATPFRDIRRNVGRRS